MRTAGSWEHTSALNAITTSAAWDYGELSSLPLYPQLCSRQAQRGLGANHKARLELKPGHSPFQLRVLEGMQSALYAAVTICFSKAKESTASKPCYCLPLPAQLIASASQLSLPLAA